MLHSVFAAAQLNGVFSITNHDLDTVRAEIASTLQELNTTNDADLFVQRIGALITNLESKSCAILQSKDNQNETCPLYDRSLADYQRLQGQFTQVRHFLFDRNLFSRTIEYKGDQLNSLDQHHEFIYALDQAVGELIHLMQYDTPDRFKVDVRQGFKFISGSTNYERICFKVSPGRGGASSSE